MIVKLVVEIEVTRDIDDHVKDKLDDIMIDMLYIARLAECNVVGQYWEEKL